MIYSLLSRTARVADPSSSFTGLLHDYFYLGAVIGWSLTIDAHRFAHGGQKGEGIVLR